MRHTTPDVRPEQLRSVLEPLYTHGDCIENLVSEAFWGSVCSLELQIGYGYRSCLCGEGAPEVWSRMLIASVYGNNLETFECILSKDNLAYKEDYLLEILASKRTAFYESKVFQEWMYHALRRGGRPPGKSCAAPH